MSSESEYIANLRSAGIDESTIAYMADLRREGFNNYPNADYGYDTPDDQPTSEYPLFQTPSVRFPRLNPPSTPSTQPVVPKPFVTPTAMPTRRFPLPVRRSTRRRPVRVPSPVGFQEGTVSETSSSSSDSDDPF